MTAPEVEFMARALEAAGRREAGPARGNCRGAGARSSSRLPDFNEALGKLRGRLLSPRLLLALPYFVGLRRPRIMRVMALGIRTEYRKRGMDAALFGAACAPSLDAGFERFRAVVGSRRQRPDAADRRDVRGQPLQELPSLRGRRLAWIIHERGDGVRTGGAGGCPRGAGAVGPPSPVRSSKSCDRASG